MGAPWDDWAVLLRVDGGKSAAGRLFRSGPGIVKKMGHFCAVIV
jgi:hypothetical protein